MKWDIKPKRECGPTPGTLFFINPRREKEKQVVLNFH